MGATGTVRANRVGRCPLKSQDTLKKEPRGAMDYRKDRGTGNVVTRWHDNSKVAVASTVYGLLPTKNVRRWSAKDRQHIQDTMPNAIAMYMGSVDRMNQNLGLNRIASGQKSGGGHCWRSW